MIKFAKIITLATLAPCACVALFAQDKNADLNSGYIYVHTSRNAPKLILEDKEDILKSDSLFTAKNLEIECGENQVAFLILSNRTVLQLDKNTKIRIKTFAQAEPFSFDFYDENEKTRSLLDMEIVQGNVRIYGTRPRATSSINITTRFGKFDVKSTKFTISISENHANIAIFEGQSTFISNNGKRDFIQNKQRGEISLEKLTSEYPMKIEYFTEIEEDDLWAKYSDCKTVFNSVEFFETKDGKVKAIRITPKEFLNRVSK